MDSVSGLMFDQNTVNEIVLWKINRFAKLTPETMSFINSIESTRSELNVDLTTKILENLLYTSGIRLPIASTILRFKAPHIYQIIDQRAYRYLYGKELNLQPPTKSTISSQIELYINYIMELRKLPERTGWDFCMLDRILYCKDLEFNTDLKIKY